jgi:hypothetical protein
MDLLERLRPKWRHPDAQVRRPAIKKLDDAALLEHIAATDPDQALRELAAERAHEVWLATASAERPLAECLAALDRLADEQTLATVAMHAAHEHVRQSALTRVSGARLLRDVVRGATDPTVRQTALHRITDAGVLRSIAVSDCPAELALQALERIDDPETLRTIAAHPSASKSVRQRARVLVPAEVVESHTLGSKEARARQLELSVRVQALRDEADVLEAAERVHAAQREWRELARIVEPFHDVAARFDAAADAILADAALLDRRRSEVDHAVQAIEENLAARAALCERVEALAGADVPLHLAEARAAWGGLAPVSDARSAALERRFVHAVEQCEERHRAWQAAETLRAEREAVLAEAEAMADGSPPAKAKAWRALERRWQALAPGGESGAELEAMRQRLTAAGERLQRRRHEVEQHKGETQQENLTRVTALVARLQELATVDALRPATARRALETADALLADLGPLPPGEARVVWGERIAEGRSALLRRVRQEEENEEWRRWANATAQEEIIARVEAVLAADDLAEGTKMLGQLQAQWEAVATATPDKAQALWDRFRTARNELRRRCDAFLTENLEKKRALVAQAAPLGDATAWNETADALRRLQAEWKAIGPVPGKLAQALWQEFREPCDRFFARRKEHFAKIDAEREAHAKAKLALCEQAEALADSTDWEATAAAIKRLQAEWKQSGAPPRAQAEQLWQRFRAACDRFFDRHRRRGELARDAEVEKAETIVNGLEAVVAALGGEDVPADEEVGRQLDAAWADWLRLDRTLLGETRALDDRLCAACERLAAARPESLRGTRLDPATTRERREKLVSRLEALAPRPTSEERTQSLQEMALALRERLAANTMAGGKGTQPARRQDTAAEVERIVAGWARLGPVLGDDARALAERFEQARARLSRRAT